MSGKILEQRREIREMVDALNRKARVKGKTLCYKVQPAGNGGYSIFLDIRMRSVKERRKQNGEVPRGIHAGDAGKAGGGIEELAHARGIMRLRACDGRPLQVDVINLREV